MILEHKKMGGVLVLTVLILVAVWSSEMEIQDQVSRDSILLLFYNIELE